MMDQSVAERHATPSLTAAVVVNSILCIDPSVKVLDVSSSNGPNFFDYPQDIT